MTTVSDINETDGWTGTDTVMDVERLRFADQVVSAGDIHVGDTGFQPVSATLSDAGKGFPERIRLAAYLNLTAAVQSAAC